MIYEVKSYSDDKGRRINKKIALDEEGYAIFSFPPIHTGILIIELDGMGNVPITFDFPTGYEYDITRCFEEFDKFAEEKIKEIKKA